MTGKNETAKILIGDDSEILNNILRDLFEESGYEVVQAFDGAECKAVFLKENPDVVLIDIQMPKIDGLDVLRYVKERSPRTVVVVMTGAGNERTAVEAMKRGAADYVNKPFSTDEVLDLVKRLLESRRIGEETTKLKDQVRRRDRYLAELTSIINEALITTDAGGKIQFVNRAASELWGYSTEDLRGKDIHFLIRGEAGTLLHRDLVRETLRSGKLEGEFHFRKKDKGTFPGYLSTSVIKENNRVRGIVIVVADLTRLNEVERRLKQSEKLASLGKVVEGVAHEVRNCLTSLGGFTLRLAKLTSEDAACVQYTRIILDDVSRLEKMVQAIEEYVRFSKRYSFHFIKTELPALVEKARDRAVQALTPSHAHSVIFSMDVDAGLPQISADPNALEEVFFNLILNAYEAMPNGGRLKVSLKNRNSAISVSFTDTGVGINSEDLGEIFNPFYTGKTVGAGMGLSKAFLLIEEHRGTINVNSQPGKGSTFEVLLPMERLLSGLYPWEAVTGAVPPVRK